MYSLCYLYFWLIVLKREIYNIESGVLILKKKRIIITCIILFLVFILLIVPFGVSVFLYDQYFGIRYTTYEPLSYSLDDFPGLKRDRYVFSSNKGQKLVGYNYYTDGNVKGIVILAHGIGGGGHNSYMDCANYFAKNGYYAFAFDATGNDESDGKAVNGLPQAVIDLEYAISFIEKQDEFKGLPIMLFGHSWGGYAVTNVLNYHPEVKAVVSIAGFNKSSDLLRSQGEQLVGGVINILMPYVNTYEHMKFGKYATNTSMNGFKKSNANIMVIHSEDDDTVQKKYGYDIYYEKYKDSSSFKFISYSDRGHNQVYYSDTAISYVDGLNADIKKYFEGYDTISKDQKAAYINDHLDRKKWADLLDEELFSKMLDFYNSSLKED